MFEILEIVSRDHLDDLKDDSRLTAAAEDGKLYVSVGTASELKDARAAVKTLPPGDYFIARIMQTIRVKEPAPSPVTNEVEFGPSTLSRGPRKPKGDSKQPELPFDGKVTTNA